MVRAERHWQRGLTWVGNGGLVAADDVLRLAAEVLGGGDLAGMSPSSMLMGVSVLR
jgi:hypothetical protein